MAIRDGRCPNCGSILHLDNTAEKGHCLFCDAVFAAAEAFEIAANPKDVKFPNLPQPKYEGPDLQPRAGAARPAVKPKTLQPKKPDEPKAPPVFREPVKVPDFKLDPKTRNRILLIILAVVILSAAIAAPLIINRDNARSQLMEAMTSIVPFEIVTERDVNIARGNNSYLLIASGTPVSREDAALLFKSFAEKRSDVYGLEQSAGIYSSVTVRLVTPDGGWLIDRPADIAAVEDGSAIKPLTP